MEPVRSIVAVFREEQPEENRGKQRKDAPGPWYEKANQWQWEDRAAAWDAHQDEQIEKRIVAERKKVSTSRYALIHKRIQKLDEIAEKLIGYLDDEDYIWLPDVKAIGNGPGAERVDLVRFNDALFSEIRAHFADIAAEMGERVKKQEITGKDGSQLSVHLYLPEQEARLALDGDESEAAHD